MIDRNKNKIKIEINKALQTVNNIIKPSSQIKILLERSQKDINFQKTDKIHQTILDQQEGKQFIICQSCRDNKSSNYRSPYTNKYYPVQQEDAYMLSPVLRDLQEKGNILFSEYAKMYYGEDNCIANFYVFQNQEGLNLAFYIKKIYKDEQCSGIWCSSNTIEVRGDPSKSVSYKLLTNVLYQFNVLNEKTKQLVEIYGSLKKNRVESKRWTPQFQIDQFHLMTTGKLIEEVETQLRQQIENILVRKTKDIIFKTRYINSQIEEQDKIKQAKDFIKIRNQSSKVVEMRYLL